MTEDPTVCELDEVYDKIEEGRKKAVVAKLVKDKELKSQHKQTEVEHREKGLTKWEVKSCLKTLSKGEIRRSCQMTTQMPSLHSCYHLNPADKRECTSDSGISHNST